MPELRQDITEYLSERPYQLPTIGELLHQMFVRNRRRIVCGAPTAAGKGTIIAHLVYVLEQRGVKRVLVVAPRREIAKDLRKRMRRLGLTVGRLGDRAGEHASIQVGTIETALKRAKRGLLPDFDVLILDEVHHFVGNTWAELVEQQGEAHAIGFTATTQRPDGRALGEVFDTLIVSTNYKELLAAKIIVPCTVYAPKVFLEGHLARSVTDAYLAYAQRRGPTLVYERSKASAQKTLKAFRELGIIAELITEETPTKLREVYQDDFVAGRLPVLINVYVLTEGVDLPNARVIILAAPCSHKTRWKQITGRALRCAKGKTRALVIDLVGVSAWHGNPTNDYEYSLDRAPEIQFGTSGGPPKYEREEFIPEVMNVELYDDGSEEVVPPEQTIAPLPLEQQKYIAELRRDVRANRLTPALARRHFEFRHGKPVHPIEFR